MKRSVTMVILSITILAVLIIMEVNIIRAASGVGNEVEVICAAGDIEKGTVIQPGMLITRNIPAEMANYALKGAPDNYMGKRADCFLHKGEVLYAENLVASINKKEEGNVLMAIDVKGDQANGWWIDEDYIVDVYIVYNGDAKKTECISDRRVAALLDEAGNRIISEKNNKKSVVPRFISLEVTPEQAYLLAEAKNNAKAVLTVK